MSSCLSWVNKFSLRFVIELKQPLSHAFMTNPSVKVSYISSHFGGETYCFWLVCLSMCLSQSLSALLLSNYWTEFYETWYVARTLYVVVAITSQHYNTISVSCICPRSHYQILNNSFIVQQTRQSSVITVHLLESPCFLSHPIGEKRKSHTAKKEREK